MSQENNQIQEQDSTPFAPLPFETQLLADLKATPRTLSVFSTGVPTVPKAVAHFLSTFLSLSPLEGQQEESFPDLIFLLNFNDMEFACIEHWLTVYSDNYYQTNKGPSCKRAVITLKKISNADNAYILNKRAEHFLKGGAFAITYKQLVLDLLTKRLSPKVISGLIINNVHRIKPNHSESFLCKLLLQENPQAFVKGFTGSMNSLVQQGREKIVDILQSLGLESILMYPRFGNSLKQSLDNLPNLTFHEHSVEMSPRMIQIQQMLLKIIDECLGELKREFANFGVTNKDQLQEILSQKCCLTVSFQSKLRRVIGESNFHFVGQKVKSLLRNIEDIKNLLQTLLNRSSVQFFVQFKTLRAGDGSDGMFSIFKHCDEETHQIINQIFDLAKQRIYRLVQRSEEAKAYMTTARTAHEQATAKSFCSLELEYGRPYNAAQVKWSWWRDKVFERTLNLPLFELEYDLQINYEQMPKFAKIVSILNDLELNFMGTEVYRDIYEPISIKKLKTVEAKKSKDKEPPRDPEERRAFNKNVLIACRTYKQYIDILKFLYQFYFKKDNGLGFYDDRFRLHLASNREYTKRTNCLDINNNALSGKTPPKIAMTQSMVEQHLLHKLYVLLEQKYQYHLTTDSKKRTHGQFENQPPADTNPSVFQSAEDIFAANVERLYEPHSIIEGYNVHVELVKTPHELEIELLKLNPCQIVLQEPHLDFIRQIEVFEASRMQVDGPEAGKIEAHMMVYNGGTEKFQFMQIVEDEKKSSSFLQDNKGAIQSEAVVPSAHSQSSEDFLTAQINQLKLQSHKHIIAVDSREFSSMTPVFLHNAGFWVIPMQLTVGDYVLSDQIAIERKAIATGDLFESFKSGRLLQQVSNMNQFYKRPCLLIEFDDDIPFKLQDGPKDSVAGAEISAQSVISKITLLTLHFPNLQILWSKGPKHTAEICMSLKQQITGADRDPDLMKIEKIGKVGGDQAIQVEANPEEGGEETQQEQDYGKLLPREFLKRIPGVNSNNMGIIMKECKNMVELVNMPFERLRELIGAKNAKMVKSFLENKVE